MRKVVEASGVSCILALCIFWDPATLRGKEKLPEESRKVASLGEIEKLPTDVRYLEIDFRSSGSGSGKPLTKDALARVVARWGDMLRSLTVHGDVTKDGLATISALVNLEALNISDCPGVTDEALRAIAALPHLKFLTLDNCDGVLGPGLAHLSSAASLEGLSLGGCRKLDLKGLEHLGKMTRLRSLTLMNTGGLPGAATAPVFRGVAPLVNLEEFKVNCNFMDEESSWDALAGLTKLKLLMIRDLARVDPAHFRKLESLKCLQELYLAGGRGVGDGCLETIGGFGDLRVLWINKSPCTQAGLRHLTRLGKIETLELSWAPHITAIDLETLASMNTLRKLEIYGSEDLSTNTVNRFRKRLPPKTGFYSGTEKKYVERTEAFSAWIEGQDGLSNPVHEKTFTVRSRNDLDRIPVGIAYLGFALFGLNEEMTREDIDRIASRCGKSLKALVINPPEIIDLDSESGAIAYQKEVERFKVGKAVAPTGGPFLRVATEAIAALQGFPLLERLGLRGCEGITDDTFAEIAKLTRLKSLDLSGCRGLKGSGIAHLRTLASLEALSLNQTPALEIDCLVHLKEMHLLSLELMDAGVECRGITYGTNKVVPDDMVARVFEQVAPLAGTLETFAIDCNAMDKQSWDILARFTRLKSLTLRNLAVVDAAQFSKLRTLKNLERLNLAGGNGVHDACFPAIGSFSELRHLNLREAPCTLHGLKSLTSLRKLETLDLSWSGFTCVDLEALHPMTWLRRVNLINASNIQGHDMQALTQALPDTRILIWKQ